MKVILLSDVSKVGKKGEIVEVADGYARNYLIRNKLGLEATKRSLEILDQQKEDAKQRDLELEAEAKELVKRLETIKLTFQVKVGKEGKVFGAISTKHIVEQLQKQFDIKVDKRKFLDTSNVDTLGLNKLRIELHKNVIGTITVHLIEQK